MGSNQHQSKKFSGQEILRDLIPLNALTDDRYQEVTGSLNIQDVSAGSYLFCEGDRDNRSAYLLDGVVNFIDANGKVTGVVSAGTDPARYPLANQQPRITTARAATKAVIARIDSTLLDVLLTLDQTAEPGTVDISPTSEEDWMSRMLQSEAFSRMAPADIQRLIQSLTAVNFKAGETVVRQGEEGDYFYIIRDGKCSVTRLASDKGWDVPLAELGPGDSFGEDALVADATRNATVTMLTDGSLMQLSKQKFVEILKQPMVHFVKYDLAVAATRSGDIWMDVRTPDEHSNSNINNSINVPLASIRTSMKKLDATKKYVLYCDTGRRSAAAAFLLGQRGFEVAVLEGGLNQGTPANTSSLPTEKQAPAAANTSSTQTGGYSEVEALRRQLGSSQAQEEAARCKLDQLQGKFATLKAELRKYTDKVMQVEIAHQGERTARQDLTDRLDQLIAALDPE